MVAPSGTGRAEGSDQDALSLLLLARGLFPLLAFWRLILRAAYHMAAGFQQNDQVREQGRTSETEASIFL